MYIYHPQNTAQAPTHQSQNITGFGENGQRSLPEVFHLPSPDLKSHFVPQFLFVAHLFLSSNFECYNYQKTHS